MRKGLFTAIILLGSVMHNQAQQPVTASIDEFRKEVLPRFSGYFSTADVADKGQLVLTAANAYEQLSESAKTATMNNIGAQWPGTLVLVKYGTQNELWSEYEPGKGSSLILDWNLNSSNLRTAPAVTQSKTSKHPFFVYVGGQGILDSEKNLNAALNTRVGFFLLKNKWDLAWTFSGGISGKADTSAVFSNRFSTGIMSKFYFPIPKLNISPNVGIDLQSTLFMDSEGSESTVASKSILAGIAWYIGPGSLDAGVRINKEPSVTIGYTFMPGKKKKK